MTHDEMIAVIAAHRDGKQLESSQKFSPDIVEMDWKPSDDPIFDFSMFEYRIAPEPPKPREWWIIRHSTGNDELLQENIEALCVAKKECELIRVREVP